jgi:DNA-binding CsgD family transcriptional regulator
LPHLVAHTHKPRGFCDYAQNDRAIWVILLDVTEYWYALKGSVRWEKGGGTKSHDIIPSNGSAVFLARIPLKSQRLQIVLASLAFCIFTSMNAFVFWGVSSLLSASAISPQVLSAYQLINHISFVSCLFLFALGASYYPRFFSKNHFPLSALFLSISFLLLFSALLLKDSALLMLCVSGVFVGLGSALCFLSWIRQFSLYGIRMTKIIVLIASALSSVLYPVLAALPQTPAIYAVALPLIPLTFILFFFAVRGSQKEIEPEHGELLRRKNGLALRETGFFVACLILFGALSPIVASISEGAAPGSTHMLISQGGTLAAAVVMFVLWFLVKRRLSLQNVFIFLLPVLAIAVLLLFILETTFIMPFYFIGSTVLSMTTLILVVFSVETSEETGANVTVVFAILASIMYLSSDLGSFIGSFMSQSSVPIENQLGIIAFSLLYFLFFLVFIATRISGKRKRRIALDAPLTEDITGSSALVSSEEERHSNGGDNYDIDNDSLSRRCTLISKKYHLTTRESQVLLLLAHGRDVPSTARILFLSENTIRTHTKGIYHALNVHTRQDLIDLVETETLTD